MNYESDMKLSIIKLGDEVLYQKASPVKQIDRRYESISSAMLDLLSRYRGVGLAGPQVNIGERIFVTQIDKDKPRVFINPSVIETSHDTVSIEEGCLSLPGVWHEIVRSKTVRVQAWNEKGRPFTIDADGLLARVILHEYDHLEGVLFIDRLSDAKRERIISKYEKLQSKNKKHDARRET